MSTASSGAGPRGVEITRFFEASRALVWRAWTDPQHVVHWWGPAEFSSPTCQIDLRVGGNYLFCMQGPDGTKIWSTGIYVEIVPLERLVYSDSFADEAGNAVPASHYGMGDEIPFAMTISVTFEDLGGRTKMTLRHEGLPPGELSEMTAAGWNESFDKLAESLR